GVQSVRSDDRVGGQRGVALREVQVYPGSVLVGLGDGVSRAQRDGGVLLTGGQQCGVQVGAVGDQVRVREAVGVGRAAQIEGGDLVTGQGIHHDQPGRGYRGCPDGRQYAEFVEG